MLLHSLKKKYTQGTCEMVFGRPVYCGSCAPRLQGVGDPDSCMCGCYNLNGTMPVFCAQLLLFVGMILSWATMVDCSFATLESNFTLGEGYAELPFQNITSLGLFTFMKPDGECYWEQLQVFEEYQIDWYINTLTSDWNMGRAFAVAGGLGGICFFLYSLSFSCSSQVRGFRWFMILILCFVLPAVQALVFYTFWSDFCEENDCRLSRSSIFCIVSAACYFEAGVTFFYTSNYPGDKIIEKERKLLEQRAKARRHQPDPEERAHVVVDVDIESDSFQDEVAVGSVDGSMYIEDYSIMRMEPSVLGEDTVESNREEDVQTDYEELMQELIQARVEQVLPTEKEESPPSENEESLPTENEESLPTENEETVQTEDEEEAAVRTDDEETNLSHEVPLSEEEQEDFHVFEDEADRSMSMECMSVDQSMMSEMGSVRTNPFYPKDADYAVLGDAHLLDERSIMGEQSLTDEQSTMENKLSTSMGLMEHETL